MQLRISAGKYKNKKLKVPESAKPLKEQVKLAVFSILEDKIVDAKVLDLCAGSGNIGLEALSRGAKHATFVEQDYDAIGAIRANIDNVLGQDLIQSSYEEGGNVWIIKEDLTKYVANTDTHYDIVFFDPPYEAHIRHALKYLDTLITNNGLIIYFHATNQPFNLTEINPKLNVLDTRKYGVTTVDFIGLMA